jgi:hypothetical protein
MREWQAEDAGPGDPVEAVDCSFGGVIVTVDRESEIVSVRVDDPRFTAIEPGAVLAFLYREVELVTPEGE